MAHDRNARALDQNVAQAVASRRAGKEIAQRIVHGHAAYAHERVGTAPDRDSFGDGSVPAQIERGERDAVPGRHIEHGSDRGPKQRRTEYHGQSGPQGKHEECDEDATALHDHLL